MSTLKGKSISSTYEGLLKTADETPLSSTPKLITDGSGVSSGVKLDSAGNVDVSNTLAFGSLKDTAEDITVSKFVDAADGIANNDNDTSLPTSAAVKDYVENNASGGTLNTQGNTGTGSVDLKTQSLLVSGTAGLSITAGSTSLTVSGATLQSDINTNTTDIATNATNIADNVSDISTNTGNIATNTTNIAAKQSTSEKGQSNGYAPLDSSAKVPTANLPAGLVGAVSYQGTWDAANNTPALPSAATSQGYYFVVSNAGTYLGVSYALGDWAISNGTDWQKVDNSQNVTTVFGRQGNVTAEANDYASFYATTAQINQTNSDVSGNSTDITTNASNISANTTSIGTNTTKLATIETGAQVNTITSVNAQIGAVSLGLLELDDVTADGTPNQVLTTNGSGTFTFQDAPGGGSGAVDSVNGQTGTVELDAADLEDVSNVAPGDGQVLRFNSATGVYEPTTLSSTAPVDSVNGQIGAVDLETDDINEGTSNLYFTDARVDANASVAANTAKVGITQAQANEIAANTLKTGITSTQRDDILANNAKVSFDSVSSNKLSGIEAGAQVNVGTDLGYAPTNSSVSITSSTGSDTSISSATNSIAGVMSTTDKIKLDGIAQGAEVNAVDSVNGATGPVSLGLLDLDDVGSDGNSNDVLITDGNGNFSFAPQSGGGGGAVSSVNGLTGAVTLDTDNISEGSNNLYYTDARVSANSAVAANTAKTGITQTQADDITANNAKVGITNSQALAITNNTAKVSFPEAPNDGNQYARQSGAWSQVTGGTVNLGVSANSFQNVITNTGGTNATLVIANNTNAGLMSNSDFQKLAGIAAGAEVNVQSNWSETNTSSDAFIQNKPTIETPAITSNGSTPSLNTGITASEVRSLIGAGTGSGTMSQWNLIGDTGQTQFITNNNAVTFIGGTGISTEAKNTDDLEITLENTSVTPGPYTNANISIDAQGRITQASNGTAGVTYTPNVVPGATTAVKNNLYIFTSTASGLTLPSSPSAGDSIKISNLSGKSTIVISRGGSNIMGVNQDLTLDNANASFEMIYTLSTQGWVIIGAN
jgi:hypothetical protein